MDENVAKAVERGDRFFSPDKAAAMSNGDWQTIRARLVELEAENERLRTHHAELEAMARDAARYRHVRLRLWPGEVQDAVDIYPGMAALDMSVCEDHGKQNDAAIDTAMHSAQAAMPNGASGETGEGE